MHALILRLSLTALILASFAVLPAAASANPVNLVPPRVTPESNPAVGHALNSTDGYWDAYESLSYEWYRCNSQAVDSSCVTIGYSSDYYPTRDTAGKYLYVEVTAHDIGGDTAAASNFSPRVVWAPGIIDNQTVGLGVRSTGGLNVDDGPLSFGSSGAGRTTTVGLRLIAGQYDGASPDAPAEGWGAADADAQITGYTNANGGGSNTDVTNFVTSDTSAVSTVVIKDSGGDPYMTVTHDYEPSAASPYLYEATVTVTPQQLSGITDLRYRRTIDWNIEPTAYDEVVTAITGNSPQLAYISDDGRASSNPLSDRSWVDFEGEAFNSGPKDHGALFDFELDTVAFGSSKTFKMYYGAAPTRADMLGALGQAGVETFSLGQNSTSDGYATGGPAVFAIGFADVGGDPVIDADAPEAVISSGPWTLSSSRNASFSFTAGGVATFTCKLDDGAWSACEAPISYESLTEGNHTFMVRASSGDGTQLIPAAYRWRVTDHPFDLYFDSAPAWWTSSTSAAFDLRVGNTDIWGPELHDCSLDGAALAPCSSTPSYTDLEPGPHTLLMRAANEDYSEDATYQWTISDDVSARFSYKPGPRDASHTPGFEIETGGPVAGTQCKLDDDDWYSCSGYFDLDPVSEGEHTFSVRAFDGDDNYQDPITSYSWIADFTGPKITTNMPSMVTVKPFTIVVTTDNPATDDVGCQFDNGGAHSCDGLTTKLLTNGEHDLRVHAEDEAGNTSLLEFHFAIQVGLPVATIDSVPPKYASKPSDAQFSFSSTTPGATFECSVNGSAPAPCMSPFTTKAGEHGWNDFRVSATAGSAFQRVPTSYGWYVGNRPLVLRFDRAPDKWSSDRDAFFEFYPYNLQFSAWADVSYQCSLDGASFTPCPSYKSYSGLATGRHNFTVRGAYAGATEDFSYEWVVSDTVGTVLWGYPSKHSSDKNPTFYFDQFGSVPGVNCKLDDGDWEPCTYEKTLSDLADGEHTFQIVGYDGWGVDQDPVTSYTWTVDTLPPVVTVGTIPASIGPAAFTLPLTFNEPIGGGYCQFDGGDRYWCDVPIKFENLSVGQHTFSFAFEDEAGNEGDIQTITFNWVPTSTDPPTTTPPITTPPTAQPGAATPVKPGLKVKKPKAKAKRLKVSITCPATSCKVSGWLKVGKKKMKLKSKTIKSGTTKVTLKFNKKLKAAVKRAKKNKVRYSVSVTGDCATTTRTGRF